MIEELKGSGWCKDLLDALVSAIPDLVCLKDPESRWMFANPTAIELFGLDGADWRGKRDSELAEFSPEFRSAFMVCEESDREAWEKGGLCGTREYIKDAGGRVRVFDLCKVPLYHPDGTRKGLLVYGRDMTALVEGEQELKGHARQLETLNELLLIGWRDIPLDVRIKKMLERLVSCNHLAIVAKGAFFMYDDKEDRLSMYAHSGLEPQLVRRCSSIEVGECVCGLAAKERRLLFFPNMDDNHHITYPGMADHGHYVVPVMANDDLLGVLCLYVPPNYRENSEEKSFLKTVATMLGKILSYEKGRREMVRRLERSRVHLSNAQRLAKVGSFEYLPEEEVVLCSDELRRILSIDFPEGVAMPLQVLLDALGEEGSERFRKALEKLSNDGGPIVLNLPLEQEGVDCVIHCELAAFGGGDDMVVMGVVQNITDFIEIETQLALARKVFEGSIEGITITDSKGDIISVNPAFTRITGYSPEEVLGKNPRILKSDRHGREFYEEMWRAIMENGEWSGEIWNRRKSGEVYPEWLTIKAIRNAQGEVTNYVAIFHDMSELHEIKENLEVNIHYDAVTGLPNRKLFGDLFGKAIGHASIHGEKLAVISVDIDDFRLVNEAIGFNVGDQVLQDMARRLERCVRKEDILGRLGGDEFGLVIADLKEGVQVVEVTNRLLKALARPFQYLDMDIRLTVSMGIAFYPDDGADVETLMKNAEMAMYRSKEKGKNSFHIFTPAMNDEVTRRLRLEERLHKALQREELLLYYQPKCDLRTGRIVGVEALLRWIDGEGESVSPDEFIPVAEESGLIVPIGEWVMNMAFQQLSAWRAKGHNVSVAVNLSPRQFKSRELVRNMDRLRALHSVPAGVVIVEITEGAFIKDENLAMEIMAGLKESGFQISMDDFGTGYASLHYLRRFPIDELKIDRSFIMDLPSSGESVAITKATLSLAQSLGIRSVAEGVETSEQLAFLHGLGCDQVQGFHVGRPLPAEKVEPFFVEKVM